MVKPESSSLSPAPESYYSLSDMSKMTSYDAEDFSIPLEQSTPLSGDKPLHRIEKSTSFVSDDEFSEPYIMDDIDEVCKNADIDSVPRRRGSRKPRPASWCGATQLNRDEDPADFDPEKLKQLQESLKQADMEREVILSCLGKEYIERVTLQSHLQSICSNFGYRLEDLIIQKSKKEESSPEKDTGDTKQITPYEDNILGKTSDGRRPVFLDDTALGLKSKNNGVIDITEPAREEKMGFDKDSISDNSRDTIAKLIEAEQRKSTIKFSHATSTVPPQLSQKELLSSSYLVGQNSSTKTTLEEKLNEVQKSPARVVLDSNFQSTTASSSKSLSMGNNTKDSSRVDQLKSSKANGQVFSNTKQNRGHIDYSSIEQNKGHLNNVKKCSERGFTEIEIGTTIAGESKTSSIGKCSTNENPLTEFKMDDSTNKQKPDNELGFDNMKLQSPTKGERVDEGIVELKEFLTDLIEENQKAAKRIVLLEKRMAKNGERDDVDSGRSEQITSSSRSSFLSRRSYTTDDVLESAHGQQSFVRSQKRRSSFSEGKTSNTTGSVHNRLYKSTLSSQRKKKPPLQRKKSRSIDSLASTSVGAIEYDRQSTLSDYEGSRASSKSPDVKEIVVTNDDNMKTVFCQASYDTNTFQYIYTIDAEMSNKEYNKLLSIINMLQEQRKKWENEVRELQSKVDVLGKDKHEVVRNNNLLRQSLEAANKAIREINSKVQELKRTIVPLRDDNAKLKEQNQTFRVKFESVRKERLKLVQEIQDLKKHKIKLEDKISNFEKKEDMRKIARIAEETTIEEKENVSLEGENPYYMMEFLKLEEQMSSKSSDTLPTDLDTSSNNKVAERVNAADVERITSHKIETTTIINSTTSKSPTDTPTSTKESPSRKDIEVSRQSSETIDESKKTRKNPTGVLSPECVKNNEEKDRGMTNIVKETEVSTFANGSLQTSPQSVMGSYVDRKQKSETEEEKTMDGSPKHDSSVESGELQLTGIVNQRIKKIEERAQDVTSQSQITKTTTIHNETNIINNQQTTKVVNNELVSQDAHPEDSKRLRDIEVQNETLMTELQNLRNRLQAYEETVAKTKTTVREDEIVEVRADQEVQSAHEDLINTSEGTIKRQLEKEEEHLIDELTRRSPMSDRGRVSACQSTEDVSRYREISERNLKRRSLEIISPTSNVESYRHEATSKEETRRSPWAHSRLMGVADMSRWASFSQDSLLDVKEYGSKARVEGDDKLTSRHFKPSAGKRIVHLNIEEEKTVESNEKPVDHLRGQQGQTIGTGYARFNTNKPVSMAGESKDTLGNAKFRAEIRIKDASPQPNQRINPRVSQQITHRSEPSVTSSGFVKSETERRTQAVQGSFTGRDSSETNRKDYSKSYDNRERHESLTDREVQEITQGKMHPSRQKHYDYMQNVQGDYDKNDGLQTGSQQGTRHNKTTIRVNNDNTTVTNVHNIHNVQNVTRINEQKSHRGKQSMDNDFPQGNYYKTNQDSSRNQVREKQLSETTNNDYQNQHSRNYGYDSDRKRGLTRSNVIETQVTTTTEYVTKAEPENGYSNNYSENVNAGRNEKHAEISRTPVQSDVTQSKKPIKGILVDRSGSSLKNGKQGSLQSQTSKTITVEEERSTHVTRGSDSNRSTPTVARLLDSKDDRRNDVKRGARARDLFKSEFIEDTSEVKVNKAESRQETSKKEAETTKSENLYENYEEIVANEKRRLAEEQAAKISQSQQQQSALYENHMNVERNSSNVLYLDELTVSDPPGSLGRSRRTRSLRVRPRSEMLGSRQNGEAGNNNYIQGYGISNFQRFGSVRSKKEWNRERTRRENMSLSLSESNLLYRSGADAAIRQASRQIQDDQHYTTDHITRSNGGKQHVLYHSQEILKADSSGMNQVLNSYCHDPYCRQGTSTLPKSSKNLKTSDKFNCEMCKQMSKRKQTSENRYCREKYFPIAHTDFV